MNRYRATQTLSSSTSVSQPLNEVNSTITSTSLYPDTWMYEMLTYLPAHCLDTLRQLLMCHAETGVLGQLWVRQSNTKSPQAFPDFNTRHICKDYETIRKWAEKHQVPPNQRIPTGYVAAPEEPHILPSIP